MITNSEKTTYRNIMDNKLFSILNSNPSANIAALGFFSSYHVESYYTENNSVIAFGKSDHLWAHIASTSSIELTSILAKHHNKTKYYFSVENWMIPLILKHGVKDWIMTTNRFVLDKNTHVDLANKETVTVDESYAPIIFENSDYKDYISIEYINDRLSKDISAGIITNSKLVAWGFTHDDGALGFVYVLKEYREKGYGLDILLSLIQNRKENNKPIFGNILPDNIASTNLVLKLGFKLDCEASWIKLK